MKKEIIYKILAYVLIVGIAVLIISGILVTINLITGDWDMESI